MLAAALLVAAIVVMVRVASPRSREQSSLSVSWHSRSMLLVDLDGDGTQDVLGQSRRVSRTIDDVRVIALDGHAGIPRWESTSIGTYLETYESFLARTGDLVLFTSRAELQAFAIEDGSLRWKVELPERIERLSDPGGDTRCHASTHEQHRPIRHDTYMEAGGVRIAVERLWSGKHCGRTAFRWPSSVPSGQRRDG